MNSPNPLWDRIQSYMDLPTHRYPPKSADLARETGVSDQVISKWKQRPMFPTAEQLIKFSRGTGIPYLELLEAAMRGKGYLPLETGARFAPLMSTELLDALDAERQAADELDADRIREQYELIAHDEEHSIEAEQGYDETP